MKICLPVMQNQGIDSQISAHFGSAPFFMIVDVNTLAMTVINNQNSHHVHGMCQPLAMIGTDNFDAIVVGGIGTGALNKLRNSGKKVFKTEFTTVKETVEAAKQSKLSEFSPQSACSHHHGGHGDGHGHHHGHDHAPHGAHGIKGFNK